MSDENVQQYRQLHTDVQELLQTKQQFLQQKTENDLVKKELELGGDDAVVYKLIGPVLLRQEMDAVKENVDKRLEFIEGEITKVDKQIGTKQEEQQKLAEVIRGQQDDLRAQAAAAARKVYDEQTGGGE